MLDRKSVNVYVTRRLRWTYRAVGAGASAAAVAGTRAGASAVTHCVLGVEFGRFDGIGKD